MSSQQIKVVLVGHCGPDAWALKNAVRRAIPDANVQMAGAESELMTHTDADLLVINRILDGDFAAENGIDLIRTLSAQSPSQRTLLVSNYEDAQREAVAAGALPGFGKKEMGSTKTADLLRAAVKREIPKAP